MGRAREPKRLPILPTYLAQATIFFDVQNNVIPQHFIKRNNMRKHGFDLLCGNLSTTMHVNHLAFYSIKATLLYHVIADQSNRSLLKLCTFKCGSGSHVVSQRLYGSLYGFLGDVIHSRYCMTASLCSLHFVQQASFARYQCSQPKHMNPAAK